MEVSGRALKDYRSKPSEIWKQQTWSFKRFQNKFIKIGIEDNLQHISFTLEMNDKIMGISVVYASTCYIARKSLWIKLQVIIHHNKMHRCFIEDFNIIIGAHEYNGTSIPSRGHIQDFPNQIDSYHLFHIPISGANFTWLNVSGVNHTQKRLDMAICNQTRIDPCVNTSCSTLIKTILDQYPLLLQFNCQEVMFKSQFIFLHMWILQQDYYKVVESSWNSKFIGILMYVLSKKLQILIGNLKAWNKSSFGNVRAQIKQVEKDLISIQEKINIELTLMLYQIGRE